MTLEALALQGRSQIYDSMAANISGRIFEIRKQSVKESMTDFQNIEHRMEHVAVIHGVTYINDSRASNVNATWFSMESIHQPMIWIAGGVSTGKTYSLLLPSVKEKVKAIICLGHHTSDIIEAFLGVVPQIFEAASMVEAVQLAYQLGKKGDIVLMSPACPSFDQYENYENRGDVFKSIVKQL